MKRALVLSGGGARGAYQVGVWKALRDLNIKYDIITGTSVGALNGALMVQDSFDLVQDFWHDIDFNKIFNDKFFENSKLTNKKGRVIGEYINAALFKRGLNIESLEKNLDMHLKEDIFYESKVDYGLVIYDIENKKPIFVTKDEIARGKLKDYVIASATLYPVFKKKEINGKFYVDGGYYDNLPINLAIDMGATDIIAVYIGVFGKRRPVKNKDVKITYIEPRSRLGFPVFFDKNLARRNLCLGYNDTMKTFDKYEGEVFTFKDKELTNYYNENKDIILSTMNETIIRKNVVAFRKVMKKNGKLNINKNDFIKSIEFMGLLFNISKTPVYTIDEYNKQLIEKYQQFDKWSMSNIINRLRTYFGKNRKYIARKIYFKLNCIEKYQNIGKFNRLSKIYPKTVISAIYIYILLNKNNIA